MKKFNKKIQILSILICILFLYFLITGQLVKVWAQNLRIGEKILTSYIRNNNGVFPANEKEFFNSQFIRDKIGYFGKTYEVRFDPNSPWISCNFGRLKIKYGVDLNNIKVINNILIDKETGNQILLIDGLFGNEIKISTDGAISYESVSLELFNVMSQYNYQEIKE